MKHSNYFLPNFISVIYKKVESNLRVDDISLSRFNEYCLAVQLYHLKKYRDKIAGLPFSQKDEQVLNHLCAANGFAPGREEEGEIGKVLIGLNPDPFAGEFNVIGRIQLLVNYFCQYEVLKNTYEKASLEHEYGRACSDLERLRTEFRLPARFKYNKTKRRDNPFFKGGVEVVILDEPIPTPNESATNAAIVNAGTSAEEIQ